VGFPMRKAAGRAALIGLMLGGGLLSAGLSQAEEIDASAPQAERGAELVAATGGPASPEHLIAFGQDKAATEAREDDVAPIAAPPAPAGADHDAPRAPTAPAPATPERVASMTEAAPSAR
jgi:hypothetical protein